MGTLTANSVTLQWGEVACLERNGEFTGYTVTAETSDGVVKGTASVNVDARQATISGLTPSTQYIVSVAAVNGAGTGPVATLPVETEGEKLRSIQYCAIFNKQALIMHDHCRAKKVVESRPTQSLH